MSSRLQDTPTEILVDHYQGRRLTSSGQLRFAGSTLTYQSENPSHNLYAGANQIKWMRRSLNDLRIQPLEGEQMRFRLPRSEEAPRETRHLGALPSQSSSIGDQFLDSIAPAFHEQGVEVRQSVTQPAFALAEHFSSRFGQLGASRSLAGAALAVPAFILGLLLFNSVLFLVGATFLAPVAIIGNLIGAGSDSLPRSWPELLLTVGIWGYCVSYCVFASRYRPHLRRWQMLMVVAPLVAYVVLIVMVTTNR